MTPRKETKASEVESSTLASSAISANVARVTETPCSFHSVSASSLWSNTFVSPGCTTIKINAFASPAAAWPAASVAAADASASLRGKTRSKTTSPKSSSFLVSPLFVSFTDESIDASSIYFSCRFAK